MALHKVNEESQKLKNNNWGIARVLPAHLLTSKLSGFGRRVVEQQLLDPKSD
jgi:hypothetical protein